MDIQKRNKKITTKQRELLIKLGYKHHISDDMNSITASKLIDKMIKETPRYKSKVRASIGAKKLQKNTPYSEMWFYNKLKNVKYPVLTNTYPKLNFGLGLRNCQYDRYIPDLINVEYKFILEIDDKSHLSKKKYDNDRDLYFCSKGFKVFRLTFNSEDSFRLIVKELTLYLLSLDNVCIEDKALLQEWLNNFL